MPVRLRAPDDAPPTVRVANLKPEPMPAVTPPPVGSGLSPSVFSVAAAEPGRLGTMPEVGETFLGFRLVDELGRGSFARVFLAEQEVLAGRQVALKVTLKPNREAERLARLQHANVVPVYSVHSALPVQVICMPFLGRRTIADQLRLHRLASSAPTPTPGRSRHGGTRKRHSTVTGSRSRHDSKLGVDPASGLFRAPHPAPEAEPFVGDVSAVLRLLRQLADGLAHAHARGVLHLDLKPANVLLADTGEPMLLDFNLSFDAREPNREMVGGTVPYMAPEQLIDFRSRGKGAVDHRTDLYSLGVMAFEMLTGYVPFPVSARALTEFDGLIATRKAGPPSLCEVTRDISPAVEAIVRKLLAPEPVDRYQSAEDLREDLDRQLADRPLRFARDTSVVERVGKWRRRNPRALGRLTAAALLAVAAVLGGVAYQHAEDRAAMVAKQQAKETRATVELLRLDLATPGDARTRPAGITRAADLLAAHGLPDDPNWKDRPAFARLSDADRAELAGDLGELLLLSAHARWQEARLKPEAERHAAAAAALRLNRAAAACFRADAAPPALARQHADLAAAVGEPIPAPVGGADRPPTARDLFLDATAALADGKYAHAAGLLEKAVAEQPNHAAAQFSLALCRFKAGEYLRAVERYDAAGVLMPKDPRPAFGRGVAYTMIRCQEAAAEAEFTRAIELAPDHADAYFNRAVVRTRVGKWREAEADLNAAIDRGTAPILAKTLRAMVRQKLGDRVGAEEDRKAALAATPDNEGDYITRGIRRLKDDPRAALADFKAAAALNPASLMALQDQAHVLADRLDQPAAALALVSRAAELYPEFAPARMGKAVLLARLGKRDEAHREAESARRLSEDPAITYQHACVYALTSATHPGDRDTAMKHLREAFTAGYTNVGRFNTDPDLGPIRRAPEFQTLVRAVRELVR